MLKYILKVPLLGMVPTTIIVYLLAQHLEGKDVVCESLRPSVLMSGSGMSGLEYHELHAVAEACTVVILKKKKR